MQQFFVRGAFPLAKMFPRALLVLFAMLCAACAGQATPTVPPTVAPTATNIATATPLATTSTDVSPTRLYTPLPSGIFVDTTRDLGRVSPYSLGTNHGPWAFLTVELWEQFKQSGISFIRFPGGNWGDENDLNDQHLTPYMMLVRMVNAEPQVSVRLRDGTPGYAVALLKYTQDKKYNIKYWSIGNEPSLYGVRFPEWTTEKYNVEWRKFAQALKAQDPTIKLIGPDIHQFTGTPDVDPKDSLGRDWLDEFLKANGDLVDVVSIHRYPFPKQRGDPPPSAQDLFASAREWDKTIPNLRARIRAVTGRDLPIAVTEFNSDWSGKIQGKTTADSVNGALYIADSLGRMIRQRVDIIAQFTLQMSAGLGALGIFEHYDPRPVYYVYLLYKQFGNELVFASSDDEHVSVYAAKRDDGTLTLVLLNLSDQEQTKPIHFAGNAKFGDAEIFLFDAKHKAESIGKAQIKNGTSITLPPSSMSLYVISASTAAPTQNAPTGIAPTVAVPTQNAPTAVAPTVAANNAPLYKDAAQPIEKRVQDLLSRMTLAEKIGQMTQVENNSITPGDVTRDFIGSVLSGGGPYLDNSPKAWRELAESYEQAALKTRLGIPLLFGVDAVHGHGHVDGATIFPHNIGLGATRDAALVEKIGRATAEQVSATAMQWNFSPVVAVPQDIRWGRTYEGYSENTELVSQLGAAYVKGLQNINGKIDLANPQTILATPKHFLGDGGTKFGTSKQFIEQPYLLDQGDTQMDEATLRELFLPPYKAAVDAGAETVMASYSSWNGLKMHAQKKLLTDVLKGELGFKGFIVSDWGGMDQITPDYYQAMVTGINAGVDMNMVPYDSRKFISTLTQAVEKGDVSQARIDDAVRRILTVKFKKGLFEQPIPQTESNSILNNAQHRALAREAVQKSLVLLRNENQTLPLKKDIPVIFVAGEGAKSSGYQMGGWTLDWQGVTGNAGGTSILDAIKNSVSSNTRVEFNSFGNFDKVLDANGNKIKADVAIVVIAERPYAEGVGDRANVEVDSSDILRLKRVRESSERVVVILLSGRPLVITEALPLADAFVAAWLPGSEGEGITDVLFGDVPFTGKTPYTFPRANSQLPFDFKHLKNEGCDAPLFPYGFGLTTNDASPKILECP